MNINPIRFLSLLLLIAFILPASAQKKQLSIESYNNPALRPETLSQLHWRKNTNTFSYMDTKNNRLLQGNIRDTSKTELVTLTDFNKVLTENNMDQMKKLPSFDWYNDQTLEYSYQNSLYRYDLKGRKISKVNSWPDSAENLDIDSSGNVAFTIKGNLYVSVNNKQSQLSKEDGYQIVTGESVHRNEFGIVKGTFWSDNGQKLAYYRMDQSMVTDYPLTIWDSVPAANRFIKYPMAGGKSHHVTVGIYDIKTQKTVWLKTGLPEEQYLTNVTWSPDHEHIYIAVLNRQQNNCKLNRYNAGTGDFELTLFEENNARYVEPQHGPVFIPGYPDQFIWQSQRDGFNHLYLYQTNGNLIRPVTKGNWAVEEVLGFDPKSKLVFIQSTQDSPIGIQTYKVDLKSGETTQISGEKGSHTPILSTDRKYLLDQYSSLTTPFRVNLIDINKGKIIRTIFESPNPMAEYETGETSLFTIKANDQKTDLYCRLIKPVNFNPAKKYPVLVYVYGGPHVQLVQDRYLGGADLFLEYMASQGYVVFTLDNRGSDHRGFEFESIIHRRLGEIEVQDQMAGIDWLTSQVFVDKSRMVCFGWSFGGFMTTTMMLKHPDLFKVAVAGGPVIDWKMYEVMYGERYMDTPEENPEGYKNNCLLNFIDKLSGRLLLIHGLQDDTVVPEHTALLINAAIAKGKLVDYFPYPNHPHNVRGKDRIHLYKKIDDYIRRNI